MTETEHRSLHVPSLEEICEVFKSGLQKNYAEVSVSVVDCPDLTQRPYCFPVKGLRGKSRITDVGSGRNVNNKRLDKVYNINTVANEINLPGAYFLGAGAASRKSLGMNAEMIFSVQAKTANTPSVNRSYIATVNPSDGSCDIDRYRDKSCDDDFMFLSNLYACEGKPGKVIEVNVKRRTGQDNFVSCMRKSLTDHYGEKAVGIGGTFIIQEGKAKIHLMPREFPTYPIIRSDDADRWLKFYEMNAPLICQSVFVSHDPGLDLRLEHTHCFSYHQEGGHYYTDTTPETVQYLGYFHPAELLYRIDRPPVGPVTGEQS
ncbi:ester hydrolase C11orf54 homolog [Spea bombifrons]|uniref:ester hydrolase C11orf54 homolog n=1 Tax=Spea bombifrons TaxID=233779 RepID=UPI00234A3240|nr:ester hydrolase C11orf54 homolog [Spea bombifrons]